MFEHRLHPEQSAADFERSFHVRKKEAGKHGIVIDNVHVDLAKMQQRKDKVVKTMNGGVRALMKTNKVTTFEGFGTITAPGKVSVKSSGGETQEIEQKHCYRDRQRADRAAVREV